MSKMSETATREDARAATGDAAANGVAVTVAGPGSWPSRCSPRRCTLRRNLNYIRVRRCVTSVDICEHWQRRRHGSSIVAKHIFERVTCPSLCVVCRGSKRCSRKTLLAAPHLLEWDIHVVNRPARHSADHAMPSCSVHLWEGEAPFARCWNNTLRRRSAPRIVHMPAGRGLSLYECCSETRKIYLVGCNGSDASR
jgi:hypothetical protein